MLTLVCSSICTVREATKRDILHQVLSYIVALNDPEEYEGGGTKFLSEDGPAVKLDKGSVIFFLGQTLHTGTLTLNLTSM